MNEYLNTDNFPAETAEETRILSEALENLFNKDHQGDTLKMLSAFQRVLNNNNQRDRWPEYNEKLEILFKCGKAVPLDGPMIGISVSIRDSDYLRGTAEIFGRKRSMVAGIEWMATAWNATFSGSGLWMGKTFEPVSRKVVAEKTDNDVQSLKQYNPEITRIGRNFFREPKNPNTLQSLGLSVLTLLWDLKDRPRSVDAKGFACTLLEKNLEKEKRIPHSKTGGYYLADNGVSVMPELKRKPVYQLNYRWPDCNPVYPMTRLVDELVQVDEGIYLGQLVLATRHYSLGRIKMPFLPDSGIHIGEAYQPQRRSFLASLKGLFTGNEPGREVDYGYQNNGFFLMIDTSLAKQVYADGVFPELRPQPDEEAYSILGYDT